FIFFSSSDPNKFFINNKDLLYSFISLSSILLIKIFIICANVYFVIINGFLTNVNINDIVTESLIFSFPYRNLYSFLLSSLLSLVSNFIILLNLNFSFFLFIDPYLLNNEIMNNMLSYSSHTSSLYFSIFFLSLILSMLFISIIYLFLIKYFTMLDF